MLRLLRVSPKGSQIRLFFHFIYIDEEGTFIQSEPVMRSVADLCTFRERFAYRNGSTFRQQGLVSYSLSVLGISPLYCNVFALYRERDSLWFSPNHIFQVDEVASEDVFFRIR